MKINGVRVNLTSTSTLAAILLCAITATAATNEGVKTDDKTQATTEKTATTPQTEASKNPQSTGAPNQAANTDNKDDSFIPSESISEDLAVSFPVDI